MANYQLLKADIDEKVYENVQQKITGANLNSVLNKMVDSLGKGFQFAGVATMDANPGTPDAKVFYIANGKGTYTNFGGLQVTEDEVVVLYYDTEWHKVATGIASQAKLAELSAEIDNIEVKTSTVKYVNEGGLFVVDEDGNIGMKYNEDGLDIAKLNIHLQSLIKQIPGWLVLGETKTTAFAGNRGKKLEDDLAKLIERLNIVDTMEDGLYFTDEDLYVGASIDAQGFHAINILEFEIN